VDATEQELARRGTEVESSGESLAAAELALERERVALRESLDALPGFLRADDVEAARERAKDELAAVQRLHDDEQVATRRLERIDEELAFLRTERETRVAAPRRAAMRAGDALADLLEDEPSRHGDSFAGDAAWLAALCAAARAAADGHDRAADSSEHDAELASAQAAAALDGFDNANALEKALTLQHALEITARQRIARAEDEQPKVEAIEGRIAMLRARREALEEVARLLNAGQFVGWLVARRQRHLLAVASEVLAGMTGDRFRFAADFTVVDSRTGQPRSPRTLSGGESFLASLALALGMAELAARSGGRIGSLYLDEGFGSLDPNALDEAIEALEARARSGQMILVISHVPTIAQRIERVLRVTPSPAGSTAEWLDDADRDALLTPAEAA
jgi:DNA repair protein SbcC/Rad50